MGGGEIEIDRFLLQDYPIKSFACFCKIKSLGCNNECFKGVDVLFAADKAA